MYQINIYPKEEKCRASQSLYGLFFEDINRAGDGGLYAELIRNRAFDDGILPENCTYDARHKLITSATGWCSSFDCYEKEGIAGWTALNGAAMQLTDTGTLHLNRRRALEVRFCGGRVENDGFQGIPVQQGAEYRFYMFAKAEQPVEVTVSLASAPQLSCAADVAAHRGSYVCAHEVDAEHAPRSERGAFGLVYINYQTQQRIPKDSCRWYKHVMETDGREL